MQTTITQVARNGFKIAAIDGRRRTGQSMCNICADNGITSALMTTLDGEKVEVEIRYNGWTVITGRPAEMKRHYADA